MIDFRYHIVSLISVFLALAVGVVLGAGPLRDAIGSQLNDQVSQLRTEKNNLRDELDVASNSLNFRDGFLAELAPDILDQQLAGYRIAVVFLEPLSEDQVNDALSTIEHSLDQAQGTVTNVVSLTPEWFDELNAGSRQAVADRLMVELDDWAGSSDPVEVLGRALAQSLTQESPAGLGELSASAQVVSQMLVTSDFVHVWQEDSAAAHLILVVTTRSTPDDDLSDEDLLAYQTTTSLQISTVEGQAGVVPLTVIGPISNDGDLLTRLSTNSNVRLSTVAGVDTYPGQVSVPLALAQSINFEFGHFGQGRSAQTSVPRGRDVFEVESPTDPSIDAENNQTNTGEDDADGPADSDSSTEEG